MQLNIMQPTGADTYFKVIIGLGKTWATDL